jgi:WXG100 family type VII secretion target
MEYRMNLEGIEGVAGRIQQKHSDIQSIITELRSLNGELDGYWDGEAQLEFEARFGDWVAQLEQFSGTLESVHQYLVTLVQARRDFEEQARAAAGGAT